VVDEGRIGEREERARARIELVATVLLALATVFTAWSAFQSTKWSGTQSIHFADAGALRTESTKAENRADAQTVIDVDLFVSWASAVAEERQADPNASLGPDGIYEPDPNTLSGFLYERFREEFRPAIDAWLAQQPLVNPDAAPTPFVLPEYDLAEQRRADRLDARADEESELARRDNQRGDNYVLATVLFASVLFFSGVSSKLGSTRNRLSTIVLAVVLLLCGVVMLIVFPVEV
jgi:hypothetical protein